MKLLTIRDLRATFQSPYGRVRALNGVGLEIGAGETVALVGESGCGKSATAMGVLGLLPRDRCETSGSILFDGREIMGMPESELRRIRGAEIGMIFQDPMTSLNPTMRVGQQIVEGLRRHRHMSRAEAKAAAIELLHRVGIPRPALRYRAYPHQLSGGQRQRIVIAIVLALRPKLIIADEPTTALDMTIQTQILDLIKEVQAESGAAVLMITHDLGIVSHMSRRVLVMYAGRVVESAPVEELFEAPRHPYTQALLAAIPPVDGGKGPLKVIPGAPPVMTQPITGCPFLPRCPHAMKICQQEFPPMVSEGEHDCSCWLQDARAKEPS